VIVVNYLEVVEWLGIGLGVFWCVCEVWKLGNVVCVVMVVWLKYHWNTNNGPLMYWCVVISKIWGYEGDFFNEQMWAQHY
jgi:hypothetical protein